MITVMNTSHMIKIKELANQLLSQSRDNLYTQNVSRSFLKVSFKFYNFEYFYTIPDKF
jgi:hypothetical protein